MTSIEQTVPVRGAVTHPRRGPAAGTRRRSAFPLLAVALAAALSGGVLGVVAAAPPIADAAGKEAVREFALELQAARERDERYRQEHPWVQ